MDHGQNQTTWRFWTVSMMRWSILLLATLLAACTSSVQPSAPAYVVSVSADGRYVVSSHRNNALFLWDIKNKTNKMISDSANIYSARFARNRPVFVWQGLNNVIHVDNLQGKEIKTLALTFPTYGEVLDAKHMRLFFSDENWAIWYSNFTQIKQLKTGDDGDFLGAGKLLNLDLSPNGKLLLSAGIGYDWDATDTLKHDAKTDYKTSKGVVLWNTRTLKPIAKLPGNAAKTYATFSPGGKYAVSADEDGNALLWNVSKHKIKENDLAIPGLGLLKKNMKWDNSGGIDLPKDYIDPGHDGGILSVKFITNTKFITIYTYEPFAFLYTVKQAEPLKYFSLGTHPFPSVSAYARNSAIDTAPEAGILVMGERDGNGIIVYHYDNKTQTLKKIWVTK